MNYLYKYLPLNIFISDTLSSSLITTVFVGMTVLFFFTEAFGWIGTGIVVPGYLAPIFIINPSSAWVIVFEAIITYLLVYFLSDVLGKRGFWAPLFGRDGFFAFVIISILVRMLFEGFILPAIGEWIVSTYSIKFDYKNNFYSLGLIVVALLANTFWKIGLRRGLFTNTIIIGLTYLIIRYILIEYTNFSITKFQFMYENISLSFFSSPKSYIILVITAMIASHFNLYYGWDSNGILLPSLLALTFIEPGKIIATFAEAVIILSFARLILKIPIFKGLTMEAGRKLFLVFFCGYILKTIIALFFENYYPGFKVTDLFGFGYLLPSLLAVKIWQKDSANLILAPTFKVAFFGILLGTTIGLILYLFTSSTLLDFTDYTKIEQAQISQQQSDLLDYISSIKYKILPATMKNGFKKMSSVDNDIFNKMISYINDYIRDKEPSLLNRINILAKKIGMDAVIINDINFNQSLLVIFETEQDIAKLNGYGIFVFNLTP